MNKENTLYFSMSPRNALKSNLSMTTAVAPTDNRVMLTMISPNAWKNGRKERTTSSLSNILIAGHLKTQWSSAMIGRSTETYVRALSTTKNDFLLLKTL